MTVGTVLSIDQKEQIACIKLTCGDIVFCSGGFISEDTYSYNAIIKNFLGLPIKRIWHFGITTDIVGELSKSTMNVVHVESFYDYPPFFILIGYAVQFESINEMKEAQGKHSKLFNADIAIETLNKMGVIKLKKI